MYRLRCHAVCFAASRSSARKLDPISGTKAHVEAPAGWIVNPGGAGGPITVTMCLRRSRSKIISLHSARAVRGEAPYPITGEDLVQHITILEPTIKSAPRWRGGDAVTGELPQRDGLMDRHALMPVFPALSAAILPSI